MTEKTPKEFRIKRGDHILNYVSKFSSTEKATFGFFVILVIISALALAIKTTDLFTVEVPATGGQVREGEIGLPRAINPVLAISDVDKDISSLIYSGLTKYQDGSFVPDLAESWTVSKDGLVYDFILKKNLTFQDKKPLTADDVVFTIQKIQDPVLKSPRQADWANVTVNQISSTEIQFTLKQPYSGFISNTTIGIIPKHVWSTVSDDQFIFSQYNVEPIGSGPYKLANISRDSSNIPTAYNLTIWSDYYNKHPYISDITFDFYTDLNNALIALNNGYIDSLPSIDPSIAAKLASNTAQGYSVLSSPLPRIFGVFFNQNQSPVLADASVRNALDLATDRNAIVNKVLFGYGESTHSPIPSSLLSDIGLKLPINNTSSNTSNIAAAQALLEKSGWTKNASGVYEKKSSKPKTPATTLSFDIYTANSSDLVTTAKMLKDQWTILGAQVDVQVFEPTNLYQNIIRTRKYDALLFGEQIGKDRDLYAFWHSSQRNAPGLNVAMYANSKVDALLSDIRATASTSTIASDYTKLDQFIRTDMPAIFLYSPDFIYAVPKTISGIHLDSIVTPSDHWSSITNWYTETEKVWKIFAK